MARAAARDPIYWRCRFSAETIELCVRRYITYRLSYRDLVAMMAERGIVVSHTTILRWVQRFVPEYERRWARYSRPVDPSWRIDETTVSVRGGKHYLYRAGDRNGKSFRTAAVTLAGVELAHRIHKRQFTFGRAGRRRTASLRCLWDQALA